MLNVSCVSSNEIEFERGFGADICEAGTDPGFFRSAAGRAHLGGVCEIGDCLNDIMKDLSYTILVPPGVVEYTVPPGVLE